MIVDMMAQYPIGTLILAYAAWCTFVKGKNT